MSARREVLLDDFLEDWNRNRTKGFTVEAVLDWAGKHDLKDDARFGAIESRLGMGDQRMQATEATVDQLKEVTGRFHVVSDSAPASSSWRPLKRSIIKVLARWLPYLVAVIVGLLAGRFGWPTPPSVLPSAEAAQHAHASP